MQIVRCVTVSISTLHSDSGVEVWVVTQQAALHVYDTLDRVRAFTRLWDREQQLPAAAALAPSYTRLPDPCGRPEESIFPRSGGTPSPRSPAIIMTGIALTLPTIRDGDGV